MYTVTLLTVSCVLLTEYLLNRAQPALESLSALAQSCDRLSHDENGKSIDSYIHLQSFFSIMMN